MSNLRLDDTIAAVSTPWGEGGIAVIRVSGKDAFPLVQAFFRSSKNGQLTQQPTHTIHHGHFLDEANKPLDEVLVSLFRAPRSYTGEDVVEISCHGGLRVTRRILERLVHAGARHAGPGEFTKRAFLHGRLDLTQAEAVLDLIRSRSDAALQTSLSQLQGSLSKKIGHLKETLLKIHAHFEASLDFPEECLEAYSKEGFFNQMDKVGEEIKNLIASFRRGLAMREGVLTVIVGRPNVGKSSLLNALLEKDRALVSPVPGTTRDALEEILEIGGVAIRLVDTAGLASSSRDELDQMGVERTKRYLKEGELFLFLLDGSSEWGPGDEAILSELKEKNYLFVVNKIDLPQKLSFDAVSIIGRKKPCLISCLTGKGLLELEKRIEDEIDSVGVVHESATLTRLRHQQALEKALGALRKSRGTLEAGESAEFVLIDLKTAIDALAELIGEIYSEDLLDVIFQEFCIGK